MTTYIKNPPLKETVKDYTTGADTFIPAFTRVQLIADRSEEGEKLALVRWENTQSVFQIPMALLREPYKDEFPLKEGEDPLESREFYERCQQYRHSSKNSHVLEAWAELKDFINHHYVRRAIK